jgi:hypothetical protein
MKRESLVKLPFRSALPSLHDLQLLWSPKKKVQDFACLCNSWWGWRKWEGKGTLRMQSGRKWGSAGWRAQSLHWCWAWFCLLPVLADVPRCGEFLFKIFGFSCAKCSFGFLANMTNVRKNAGPTGAAHTCSFCCWRGEGSFLCIERETLEIDKERETKRGRERKRESRESESAR